MLGRVTQVTRAIKPAAGQTRGMASHGHGPPPTYTGIEAKIRAHLPENHHIVMATLGFYTVLSAPLWFPGGKKEKKEEAVVASTDSSTDIPSIADDSFDAWSKIPGNIAKWEKSLETAGN
ncbi:Aste57867_5031 [Aphanomyces stellatus]|uniref:Aste57867_5031 protein n=1 Tax=Aphanomyces stellatus TaxID=120398 RepID=A0A485KH64_9STRA|nr:hypothetical protein As57867_005018 [Aphanomyces stellatus]VFT82112.1 Aste57867_5031 [Aphanomyces stellatus]